jgi:hypothetical protein
MWSKDKWYPPPGMDLSAFDTALEHPLVEALFDPKVIHALEEEG